MIPHPIGNHRLFFAISPPLPLARQITQAASWFDIDGHAVRPEHLHTTIDILEDCDRVSTALERRLKTIGDAVMAAPFAVAFDTAVGSPHAVALRPRRKNSALHELRDRIVAAREATGLAGRDGYRFGAHMTLGYRKGQPFSQPITPIGWIADAFVLIHSHLGRARHEVIGRWMLNGDDDRQLTLL